MRLTKQLIVINSLLPTILVVVTLFPVIVTTAQRLVQRQPTASSLLLQPRFASAPKPSATDPRLRQDGIGIRTSSNVAGFTRHQLHGVPNDESARTVARAKSRREGTGRS